MRSKITSVMERMLPGAISLARKCQYVALVNWVPRARRSALPVQVAPPPRPPRSGGARPPGFRPLGPPLPPRPPARALSAPSRCAPPCSVALNRPGREGGAHRGDPEIAAQAAGGPTTRENARANETPSGEGADGHHPNGERAGTAGGLSLAGGQRPGRLLVTGGARSRGLRASGYGQATSSVRSSFTRRSISSTIGRT